MRMDAFNGSIINTNKKYIHDYIFKGLKFDYLKKNVYAFLLKPNSEEDIITISFCNVLGLDMISCDFWGKSPHVFDWEFVEGEESLLTSRLFEEKNTHNYLNTKLDYMTNHIETIISLISGDLLTITCEYIDFEMED